jgi:hypothetical protein
MDGKCIVSGTKLSAQIVKKKKMTEWKVGDKAWIKSYLDVHEVECLVITPTGTPIWWDGTSCIDLPTADVYSNKSTAVRAVAQRMKNEAEDFRNSANAQLQLANKAEQRARAYLQEHGETDD